MRNSSELICFVKEFVNRDKYFHKQRKTWAKYTKKREKMPDFHLLQKYSGSFIGVCSWICQNGNHMVLIKAMGFSDKLHFQQLHSFF